MDAQGNSYFDFSIGGGLKTKDFNFGLTADFTRSTKTGSSWSKASWSGSIGWDIFRKKEDEPAMPPMGAPGMGGMGGMM